MKSYSSRAIIKILEYDGWFHVGTAGDQYQFKHKTKKGKVTVTHPSQLIQWKVSSSKQRLKD